MKFLGNIICGCLGLFWRKLKSWSIQEALMKEPLCPRREDRDESGRSPVWESKNSGNTVLISQHLLSSRLPSWMVIMGGKYIKLTRTCFISPQRVHFFLILCLIVSTFLCPSKLSVCNPSSPKFFFFSHLFDYSVNSSGINFYLSFLSLTLFTFSKEYRLSKLFFNKNQVVVFLVHLYLKHR